MPLSASPLRAVLVVFRHALNIVGALLAPFTVFFMIPRFTGIYHDMLGGQPLPPLTVLILRLQPLWILSALVFVLTAHRIAGAHGHTARAGRDCRPFWPASAPQSSS